MAKNSIEAIQHQLIAYQQKLQEYEQLLTEQEGEDPTELQALLTAVQTLFNEVQTKMDTRIFPSNLGTPKQFQKGLKQVITAVEHLKKKAEQLQEANKLVAHQDKIEAKFPQIIAAFDQLKASFSTSEAAVQQACEQQLSLARQAFEALQKSITAPPTTYTSSQLRTAIQAAQKNQELIKKKLKALDISI